MNLSPQQEIAQKLISDWLKTDDKRFVLGGFAGTGKSTLITSMFSGQNIKMLSYTGKAASVLREKGQKTASTIHKSIYCPTGEGYKEIEEARDNLISAREQGASEAEIKIFAQLLERYIKENGGMRFVLNPDKPLMEYPVVVVDEYSMVDPRTMKDLEESCRKVIYLGDPFQLPPPKSSDNGLKPDLMLTEVHRQALDSNVLRLATYVREGKKWWDQFDYDDCRVTKKSVPEDFTGADQIIVGMHKTRRAFNKRMRQLKGFNPDRVVRGDKIVFKKNNHMLGIFNGVTSNVTNSIFDGSDYILSTDSGVVKTPFWSGDVEGREIEYDWKKHGDLNRFDYGYALTCHSCQGSEWDSVAIKYEPVGDEARWAYTGISRSKRKVTVLV